ncbi:hypothetical protein BV898_03228 [Hypsibius exemplaris]|uniref:Uncharacterized protein n=1 Tax=Hypsibius exemplaris TaxID=2072580 RepID=A0A1W0X645_HYPEX|nr:hypothetical protein BV898_03228 [Hypsibius exemplaris]
MIFMHRDAIPGPKDNKVTVEAELLKLLAYFAALIFCFYGFWFINITNRNPSHYRITFSHTDNYLLNNRRFKNNGPKIIKVEACLETLTALEVAESVCGHLPPEMNGTRYLLKPLRNLSIAFIGDSRIRDVFHYFRCMLRGHPFRATQFFHDDIYKSLRRNLTLSFYWSPFPNAVLTRLASKWKFAVMDPPQYAIMQFGAWSVMKLSLGLDSFSKYSEGVRSAAIIFGETQNQTLPIWMQTLPGNPFTNRADSWVKHANNSEEIERYGREMRRIAEKEEQIVWTTAHDIGLRDVLMYRDHIHPGTTLIQKFACQLLSFIGSKKQPISRNLL